MNYRILTKHALNVLLIAVIACSCAPFHPVGTDSQNIKVSGWEESYGIESFSDSESIPKLTNAICDCNDQVSIAALKHLTSFGPEAIEAVPMLKLLAAIDENRDIRNAATIALTKIAGSDDDDTLYIYELILLNKSRSNENERMALLNMLVSEEHLSTKVVNLLKEYQPTEPHDEVRRAMLEIITKNTLSENV